MKRVVKIASAFLLAAAALGYAAKGPEVPSTRILVIPVEFSDLSFSYSPDTLIQFLNSEDFKLEGACGSVKKYFSDQFGTKTEFIFDLAPVVTLPYVHAHYGANDPYGDDVNPGGVVIDACNALKDSLDFSVYDNDSDGELDHLVFIYAGRDESDGGNPDCLWSHSYRLSETSKTLKLNGVSIDLYCCVSELGPSDDGPRLAGIGRFCHELLHTFGLPDFYDTQFSNIQAYYSAGLWGSTSIMDKGFLNNGGHTPPNLNAIEREILGLGSPIDYSDSKIQLRPIENGEWFRMESDTPDEYYLAEYRSGKGWDEHIGGHGMLVYHIDKSGNDCGEIAGRVVSSASRWEHNIVNGNPLHQCADLIEASADIDRIWRYSNIDSLRLPLLFFPAGASELGAETKPELRHWSGKYARMSFSSIAESYPDAVSFQLKYNAPVEDSGDVPHINTECFPQNGEGFLVKDSRVPLKVDNAKDSEVQWYADDIPIQTDADGRIVLDRSFCLKAKVLGPDGKTIILTKEIRVK